MKILTIAICIIICTNSVQSQEKLQKFYSSDWKELSKDKGEYTRDILIISDSIYYIQDYIRKGMKLIMRGYFKSIEPFIENGPIEYFDDFGSQIMQGQYKNGQQIGTWNVNNYFQIQHAELDYNFPLKYSCESSSNFQQKDSTNTREINSETMPEFPGGLDALRNYLSNYTIYPYKCYLRKLSLKALVSFTINKNGLVSDPVIVKSSGLPDYDKEVIRVIRSMPQWRPGTQNDQPIDIKYTVPMSLSCQ